MVNEIIPSTVLDGNELPGDHLGRDAALRHRMMHDESVLIEEYFYYAKIQREQERQGITPEERGQIAAGIQTEPASDTASGDEKTTNEKAPQSTAVPAVTAHDWETASRATRNASWVQIVYLITTDILGPSNAPWAISQFGYLGGILTYILMGVMAFYAGWQIWRMFLALDSDKYPMRTFGDMGFRIYGKETRHGMNILQSIQLLFNVGVIIIGNGQALSQMSQFKLCFSICCLIWPLVGFVMGQIRTLARFGHVANFAIWINILVLIITMAVACHSLPNYAVSLATYGTVQGPIVHTVWVPSTSDFNSQTGAAMQIVYAYGGAMLYCEFMSEMRRPLDFIKAQFFAEGFIMTAYLIYGLVMYSQQGQFTYNPANQGIDPYWAQTLTNALSVVSGLIAAVLYGNIGIKVIYQNIVQDLFGGPELASKRGKIFWIFMVPIYWSAAFVIASAVPQFTNISSMVAATCIMQFTYTFPAILYLGYQIQEDALLPEEVYDPVTGRCNRVDTWRDLSRWKRGLARMWYFKLFNFLFFCASLTTAGIGMYGSALSLQAGFAQGHATSFGCAFP